MRRILVVDEKIENLNSMEKMIYEAEPDAWIVTFLQYTEALDFVRENPCDVLFVDLESAGIRGLLFAKAVKKFHRTINIIFQASTDDYANEAMQIRASGYMRGPVTSEKVMAELHELAPVAGTIPGDVNTTGGDNSGSEKASDGENAENSLNQADALEEILKYDNAIQPGPYVQIPEEQRNTVDEEGNTRFTVEIPPELLEEGRTFYLMTVDSNGNVVILTNDSIEDGVISVTGDPNATYQIIYEDGGETLTDMIGNDGTLLGPDGKHVQVSTNHCFWHWMILLTALIGAIAALMLGRRKKKIAWLVLAIATVLSISFAILGICRWDWIFTVISVIVMLAIAVMLSKNRADNKLKSKNA